MNALHLTPTDLAALTTYPELRRLVELRQGHGWFFQPIQVDGELELLTGARVWPDGWSDAIVIRDPGDAKAVRCDPDGGVVWERDGGLADVLDALVELPTPADPKAPRLVKGTATQLWIPRPGHL